MNGNNLILNRLFTQNVFQELISGNKNATYCEVVRRYATDIESKNNEELISEIYGFMSESYRNEYYYKNTMLNKLLLGKHSVRTTTALTEIPINKSKADFILINGKAIVYEIKTELDSFDRLETQLKDYYKAFSHVCVVTCEHYFSKLCEILHNTPVGICVLTNHGTISRTLQKEALEYVLDLDYTSMFKVLHKNEFENIIKHYYGELPVASQVFYYDECFAMFSQIPILEAYKLSVKQLKRRNNIVRLNLKEVPYELRSLVYFSNPTLKDFDGLKIFLNEQFRR